MPLQRETLFFLAKPGRKGGKSGHVDRAIASGDILRRLQKYYRLEQNIIVIVNKDNPALQNPARFLHKKSGKQFQNSAKAEFWSFEPLQRGKLFLWQNLIAKAAKTLVGMTGFGT